MASSVWESKYTLVNEMVPTIINEEVAKKIYLIGKSLNFIRFVCGDAEWVEGHSKTASKEYKYGDSHTLESSIQEAYKATTARLIHLMAERFHLFDHLRALRRYILLGQGDFIALLMESLSSSLDRPSATLYRHNLTAQLEHAIRGSNAQYESADVLRRLDARLLDTAHGDIGWDVFTLEYKIDAPVDVVVTSHCTRQYLKVFNFLWRTKRVEFTLSTTWRKYTTGARGVLSSISDLPLLSRDWAHCRATLAEMIHFIMQLQYYILFEVIDSSWNTLLARINEEGTTLDDIISAHRTYLATITEKALLSPTSRRTDDPYLRRLHDLFKLMLAYKSAADALYSFSLAEFSRRQALASSIAARTAAGKWGTSDTSSSNPPSKKPRLSNDEEADLAELRGIRENLDNVGNEFRSKVVLLLSDLHSQKEDANLKMLAVLLNFNGVYVLPTVRKRERKREKEREKEEGSVVSGGTSGSAGASTAASGAGSVASGRLRVERRGGSRAVSMNREGSGRTRDGRE